MAANPTAVLVAPVSANVWQIPQLQPERDCDDDVRRFNERVPREPRTSVAMIFGRCDARRSPGQPLCGLRPRVHCGGLVQRLVQCRPLPPPRRGARRLASQPRARRRRRPPGGAATSSTSGTRRDRWWLRREHHRWASRQAGRCAAEAPPLPAGGAVHVNVPQSHPGAEGEADSGSSRSFLLGVSTQAEWIC